MSFNITVNKTHNVGGAQYKYKLGRNQDLSDLEIALSSATIPFSWFNITQALNNNSFQLIHPTTAGSTTLTINLVNGGYNVEDLDSAMRVSLINQGYYIQNNTTLEQRVYAKIKVNPATYQIQLVSYNMETSLPSGWSAGSSITFPGTTRGPQFVFSNNITTRLGFSVGTYPAIAPTVLTVTNSTAIPVISDVTNIMILLDSAYNPYSQNNQVLTSISPAGTSFGRLISFNAPEFIFTPQQSGARNELTFRLTDQFFRELNLVDNDIVLNLVIRKKN